MNSTSTYAKKRCEKCLEYVKLYITCFKCDAAYHIYCWRKVPGAYLNQYGRLLCCADLTSNNTCSNTNLGIQYNPPERVIEKWIVDDHNKDLENCVIKEEDSEWNEFKCDACLLQFTSEQHLENHYRECPNKEVELIQELKEDKDLENYVIKEEASEWNEFKCDACRLEFMDKENLENHYNECPNKQEEEFVQELKEDKDLENCLHKEENLQWDEFKCDAYMLELTTKECLENFGHNSESPNNEGEFIQDLKEEKVDLPCSSRKEENFQKQPYKQHATQYDIESSYLRLNKDNNTSATDMKSNPVQGDDKEKNYKCTDCQFSSYDKTSLVKHKCIHTKERPFKCNWCDYAAVRRVTLKDHIKVKHSNTEKGYKCRDCEYSTYTKRYLINHIRTHTNEKPFKCDMCDYASTMKFSLKRHVLIKHSNAEKMYKCENCEYSSYTKGNLLLHKTNHTNAKPFKCDMCDYAAAFRKTLKSHIKSKHSNVEKEHKCTDCTYSTDVKKDLERHIRTHTNEKPFKCDMCDYAAASKTTLKRHVLVKHSNAEKMYKCEDCEYSFFRERDLLKHKRTHTNEKPFRCDICDYAAARKENLRVHIKAKHSNSEKGYKCSDCEYSTYEKRHLERHIRTHTNEKPFKCDMCDYAAASNTALKRHVFTKHSKAEKMYKCGDCEYSSYTKDKLLEHMRIHTKEKPFKCDTCDYVTAQKSNLNRHILLKHSNSEESTSVGIANFQL